MQELVCLSSLVHGFCYLRHQGKSLSFFPAITLTLCSRRSAAEVDELFERKIKAWRFAKTQTAKQRAEEAESEEQLRA